jgi:hypothetical protein
MGKAAWWVCVFAFLTKALSFPDPKAVIIEVTLSCNAVSSKLPISHLILNVSRGQCISRTRLSLLSSTPVPALLSSFHPKSTSIPRRYPDLLLLSKNCLPSNAQSLPPSAPPISHEPPSTAQRSLAHSPPTTNSIASTLSIKIVPKASKCTRELSCSLSVLAAVHDQHVCDPGSALLVCPPPMCDEISVDAKFRRRGV